MSADYYWNEDGCDITPASLRESQWFAVKRWTARLVLVGSAVIVVAASVRELVS